MAVTASGLHVVSFRDALGAAQLALDLDAETHRLALFNNTITPDFDAAAAAAAYGGGAYAAGEVFGTGWAAGGVLLTGTTLTGAAGTLTFDATDISVSGTTLNAARCGLIYADALTGNNAIALINFGADYSTNNGLLQINWAALGIFYIDLTP
jgi:hypothetical protein